MRTRGSLRNRIEEALRKGMAQRGRANYTRFCGEKNRLQTSERVSRWFRPFCSQRIGIPVYRQGLENSSLVDL
jgi:hypothetical protein